MVNTESKKEPMEEAKTARSLKKNSEFKKGGGTAPVGKKEYKETILLFIKILVTIFLCEAAIMALLYILPLRSGWNIVADPLLLTFLGTPVLYWLLVKPVWLALEQRTRAVEALESERDFAESLITTTQAIVLLLDEKGRIKHFNPYMERISGYWLEEVKGKDWFTTFLPERDRKRIRELFSKVSGGIQTHGNINPIVTKDGCEREIEWYDKILKDANGNVTGLLATGQDITERKKAEEKLRHQTELLNSIRQAQSLFITQGDPQSVFDVLVETLVSMTKSEYGFLDEVRQGENGQSFKKSLSLSNISWDEESRKLYEVLRTSNLEFRNLNNLAGAPALMGKLVISNDPGHDPRSGGVPKGHPPIHSFMGVPMFFGGEMVGIAGVANRTGGYSEEIASSLDAFISTCASIIHAVRKNRKEQKITEALYESEYRYRSLVEANPYGIQEINASGIITYTNPAYQKILGYSEQELLGKSILDLLEPESRREELRDYLSILVEEQPQPTTYYQKSRTKEGRVIDTEVDWNYNRDNEGRVVGFISIVTDVTEHKKIEEELRQYDHIVSSSTDMMALLDKRFVYLAANASYLEAFKKTPDEMIGYTVSDVFGKEFFETVIKPNAERCLSGEKVSYQEWFDFPVYEPRYMDINYYPYIDINNEVSGFVVNGRDITERKKTGEKLLHYQAKLKSLASQLSLTEERERRRIATELHDQIGQSLVFSKIQLDELHQSATSSELTKALGEICNNIDKIIQDTRTLTFDLSSPILNELGLEAAVAEWLDVQIREKHGIETEFEDDRQQKLLDDDIRALLFRNVRELLVNVIKHAHAHKVKVSVRRVNEHIRIDVEDDGKGFDSVKMTSTATEEAKYGLFSIRERLEHLGGSFEIKSEPGSGSKITMTAPLK